ncbi:putative SPRY domain/Ankyrin repeats (3 copies) [Trypanosoma cruzi]|nr:putative SPRY domain/Ankyrin repeats (3 copies) [Trypanosoma cruzi]
MAAEPGFQIPRFRVENASTSNKRGLENFAALKEETFTTTLPTTTNDDPIFFLEALDVFSCTEEEFLNGLAMIKEFALRSKMKIMKRQPKKGYARRKMEAMQEELLFYRIAVARACTTLREVIDRVKRRLCELRRDEALLHEYYQALDTDIERGEREVLPKEGSYHLRQRELRRVAPRQRYREDRTFVEARHEKLNALLHELEEEEIAIQCVNEENGATDLDREYGICDPKRGKLEDIYDTTAGTEAGSSNLELRLRIRPLLEKVRELRIVPPLSPRSVQSRLRKELLLPFSARVLALKNDEDNNAGERFVEWYVNAAIDPLAMAQLVELVPREYLVTTTVRLVNACDTYLPLRQTQALPDVLHVLLQAIAEGRFDDLASLVLSPSDSYLHALESREHAGIIFYAALITGQMEVLRHLMSVGFYNTNALIVWLFLNPNRNDPNYMAYVTEMRTNIKKYMRSVAHQAQDNTNAESLRGELEEDYMDPTLVTDSMQNNGNFLSVNRDLCETLRRFLQERMRWKKQVVSRTDKVTMDTDKDEKGNLSAENPPVTKLELEEDEDAQAATRVGSSSAVSGVSFSLILGKKRLDRLQISSVKCAVLPAVTTSFMRRVDRWGYTPLKATDSHFLLVGDTSTANAHIIQLPPRHADLWPDDDPTVSPHVRWQRERKEAAAKAHGLTFYYEVHVSLNFLLSGVPVSTSAFNGFSASLERNPETMPGLQTSTVFVGWCSEECTSAADGRSTHPPLGSDRNSIGISFDILHRSKVNQLVEEVIIRPMKHERGRNAVYQVLDEDAQEKKEVEDKERDSEDLPFPLLRILLENNNEGNDVGFVSPTNGPFSSPIYEASASAQTNETSEEAHMLSAAYAAKESIVPTVEVLRKKGNGSTSDSEETSSIHWNLAFGGNSVVLRGVPVYNSQSLVVGCHVDFGAHSASFTVNGKSLGIAFTTLPSPVGLRPAVSLQASNRITEVLQRVKPSAGVIVRFVFNESHLLASQTVTTEMRNTFLLNSSPATRVGTPDESVETCREFIPGVFPLKLPLLFDENMMHCALIRLVTCGESALLSGHDSHELIQAERETLSLGHTLRVTASGVRQMLNAKSDKEDLLFFPPVLLKRRSDDTNKGAIGVAIIPEDVSLVPLCIALTQRQRVAAYRIAVHPFTDFVSQDDASKRQRRMALLGSATLGYTEVLYALLERMSISETLNSFALKMVGNEPEYFLTAKQMRVFFPGNSRKCTSATMLHRVEYTPLHCALLEKHQECVHLLLYYLSRLLPAEHKRHAVNVLTRSGETALLMACRFGYTKIAMRLLAMGASPSSFDRVTRTNCLELACASRSEEIAAALLQTSHYRSQVAVNLAGVAPPICWCALNNIGSLIPPLLKNGANLNVTLDGLTPLLLAVTFGSQEAALKLLECCDAVSNVSNYKNSSTRTIQHRSPKRETFHEDPAEEGESRFLAVLDVDALDPLTQSSALHLACELGQLEVTRGLIAKGASLNLQNKTKYATPLQVAIMNRNEHLALELLEYAKDRLRRGSNVLDISAIEKNGNTALHLAAREGMLQVIEYIIFQFSDEEITRISCIHNFLKRPDAVNIVEKNRQGMTPLLVAIHAHQEAAAQLIASLMPESLPNPGGPVIDGTCVAILSSDAESLDNLTLYFLSQPRYFANDAFREEFFARYNAKRLEMDLCEDGAPAKVDERKSVLYYDGEKRRQQKRKARELQESRRRTRYQKKASVSSALLWRTSLTPESYAWKLGDQTGTQKAPLSRRRSTLHTRISRTGRHRRRSTFVQMLLAKGGSGFTTLASIRILEQGFPLEEVYVMADIISTETTHSSQTVSAMQHVETLISFLREYGGVRIATGDAVVFSRQLLATPSLEGIMDPDQLENAKKRLAEMRPLCRDLMSIIRSYGQRADCVEDLRHMVEQHGVIGTAFVEEVTSPFGFTVLQLAATLGLSHVCDFFLNECEMSPLYVPATGSIPCSESKWFLSPFRLALRSTDVDTVSVFLSLGLRLGSVQEILEHKELPKAEKLQQTAIQELICQPVDTLPAGTTIDTLHILRLLLQSGAVLQGNFDAEGNDAWMLAVRACPGKGTKLQVFLDEQVPLGEEEEDDVVEEESSQEVTSQSSLFMKRDSVQRGESTSGMWTTISPDAKEGLKLPLAIPFAEAIATSSWMDSPFRLEGALEFPRMSPKKRVYYTQLVFLCAEYNPQSLIALLEQYSYVLSPSVIHPVTGDTLPVFLLRRAVHIYSVECGSHAFFQGNASLGELFFSTRCFSLDVDVSARVSEKDPAPYRDPITIPGVRRLLLVVERLLRKFCFDNLYYEDSDGQTALSLAARLSYTNIVSLIVQQRVSRTVGGAGARNGGEGEFSSISRLNTANASSDRCAINEDLVRNLEASSCWVILATRLYYAEEEMDLLLAILRHLPATSTKFSFLSMVYSNLHPIVALRVAVLYANDVKNILMQPEAINAFWSNVLYAQFVGRLEEVTVTSAEWTSLLSVLLPAASAIPIYLIKSTPLLPMSSSSDTSSPATQSPLSFTDIGTSSSVKNKRTETSLSYNWGFIVKKTRQYVRQLAAAAVCVVSPPSAIAAAYGGGAIPSSQRHVLTIMSSHFHELIELAVRFDNSAMLMDLMSLSPAELQACVKHEWRYLMEKYHIDVIAIAAGSINVLKAISDVPDAAALLSAEQYERIDPNTGLSEDAGVADEAAPEHQNTYTGAFSIRGTPPPTRGDRKNSAFGIHAARKTLTKIAALNENKGNTKKARENKNAVVNIFALDAKTPDPGVEGERGDVDKTEANLRYMDVMTAARERQTASAVTWGIGPAARPVSLQERTKSIDRTASHTQASASFTARKKMSDGTTETGAPLRSHAPRGTESTLSTASVQRKTLRKSVSLEGTKSLNLSLRQGGTPFGTTPPPPPPRYFAYYLCDWALHTTLLLHAPRPSSRTIDTLLYLMDQRAPLTTSAVQLFLAASRPLNCWESSDGEMITLNYVTRKNKDTILHILVQNGQLRLTRYFLASALCYFTYYQYDPPSTMPPNFALMDMPKLPQKTLSPELRGAMKTGDVDALDDDESHPAVFLRSMLRMNKHGLTPFDYARGPMVSLLMEYGCVPPTYRPNPRGFCRAIRLPFPASSFYSVPRLLLVSMNFIELHDEGIPKPRNHIAELLAKEVADATLVRNQAASQRTTRTAFLPPLLSGNVSLLHLGLCSADDELVLQHINEKRRQQLRILLLSQMPRASPTPYMMTQMSTSTLGYQRQDKLVHSSVSGTKDLNGQKSSTTRGKDEKELSKALKLVDTLCDRGFVLFPLVLPLDVEASQIIDEDAVNEGTAILLTMTPMALAVTAGVVKRDEHSQSSSPMMRRSLKSPDIFRRASKDGTAAVPPRFIPTPGKNRLPADTLDAWVASRRLARSNASGKDPHMHLLVRTIGSGLVGRTIHHLGLSTAPSYESHK